MQVLQTAEPGVRPALKRIINPVGSRIVGSVNGATSRRTFGLTFDDGPDRVVTAALLDLMHRHGVTATFFVLLSQARRSPEVLHRALAEGHEIGLHGISHDRISDRSRSDALSYLRRAKTELEDLLGQPVRFYRPPFGSQTVGTWLAARQAGLQVVVWSCEAADWIDRDVSLVADAALEGLAPGEILLLHDRIEPDPRTGVSAVTTFDRVALVDRILTETTSRGWHAAAVGELIGSAPLRRTVWLHR